MLVDEATQQDGDCLSQSHNYCKDNWAELADRKEDEELADSRTNREQQAVVDESGVLRGELDAVHEAALDKQRRKGEYAAKHIDAEHHLHGRHAVALEQRPLPVGVEGVAGHVHAQQEDAR